MTARSYLYVPGDRPDRLGKALDRAGDAIIVDLEDGVPPPRRDSARGIVAEWLATLSAPRPELWVRVNGGPRLADDLAAVAAGPVTGVVVPKATRAELILADRALDGTAIRLVGLVETAAGLLEASQLAVSARVSHLAIGEADLAADLGMSPDEREGLLPLRMQLVVASAAARLAPPTGPVDVNVRDLSGLAESSRSLRRIGFGARSAIHPDQVPVIEEAFTPSADEVSRARELIAAWDGGTGVSADGRFVDEAVLRTARRVVELADRLGV